VNTRYATLAQDNIIKNRNKVRQAP
jgi:hypothetical protein